METVQKIFGVKAPRVYSSKETPVFCANPELVCGVELEVENASSDRDYYMDQFDGGLWSTDRDGSLRGGESAYEFISRPVQMQHLIPELEAFFKFTKFNEQNYSDRCSVHVHTNVTDFTQDMLASLGLVYSVVEETLFKFVNHYNCPEEQGYCRDTNLYCIPWNQCRMNYRLVEAVFNPGRGTFSQWQKYTALNLLPITSQGTVEWRHMHGTADMKKLTLWLNVIGSIMRYARRTSLEDVIKTIKTLNDTSAYRQFFTAVTQDYLPYDDSYASTLSEGVVNAKYSLMDWDRSKVPEKMAKGKKTDRIGAIFDEEVQAQAQANWITTAEQRIREREQELRARALGRDNRARVEPAPLRAAPTRGRGLLPPDAAIAGQAENVLDRWATAAAVNVPQPPRAPDAEIRVFGDRQFRVTRDDQGRPRVEEINNEGNAL